jgi:hypothetical protein
LPAARAFPTWRRTQSIGCAAPREVGNFMVSQIVAFLAFTVSCYGAAKPLALKLLYQSGFQHMVGKIVLASLVCTGRPGRVRCLLGGTTSFIIIRPDLSYPDRARQSQFNDNLLLIFCRMFNS